MLAVTKTKNRRITNANVFVPPFPPSQKRLQAAAVAVFRLFDEGWNSKTH